MLSIDPPESHTTCVRSPGAQPVEAAAPCTFCYSIHADATPGVMPRVLALFAKRSLVPSRWVSGVHEPLGDRGELVIDLQVDGLDPQASAYLARCLAQLADVRSVLTSEKGRA